jgi:hypothetical protein
LSLRVVSGVQVQHGLKSVILVTAEINLGGTLQLLVDLQYLAGAFSPLLKGRPEGSVAAARETIVAQAVAIAAGEAEEPDPLAPRLEQWLESAKVGLCCGVSGFGVVGCEDFWL